MVSLKLKPHWDATKRAMQALGKVQVRIALAVATTKTAQAVGLAATDAFAKEGFEDIFFRVGRMALPSRLEAMIQAEGYYEIDLPPPRQSRPQGQALRGMLAELQRTGRPIQRKARVEIPHGKLWVKNPYTDPTSYIGQGAFAMVTRAGRSFNAPSSSRAGKQLAILAQRIGASRLPVRYLGRLYPEARVELGTIAKTVAPVAFEGLMAATLAVAYRKAGLPADTGEITGRAASRLLYSRLQGLAA